MDCFACGNPMESPTNEDKLRGHIVCEHCGGLDQLEDYKRDDVLVEMLGRIIQLEQQLEEQLESVRK